ncbi:hypothetical protein ACFYQ5_13330 [Streptomyces sp. NPDC005794]|uniref:hypothetical protein n=1 Tax=Streptomyces sp. NPDC005794 TaxID=3364733 RepID=UPI0036A6B854
MAAPRRYRGELRGRATRLTVGARRAHVGRAGTVKRLAEQLDIRLGALRTCVRRAEADGGLREGPTGAEAARITEPSGKWPAVFEARHTPTTTPEPALKTS